MAFAKKNMSNYWWVKCLVNWDYSIINMNHLQIYIIVLIIVFGNIILT